MQIFRRCKGNSGAEEAGGISAPEKQAENTAEHTEIPETAEQVADAEPVRAAKETGESKTDTETDTEIKQNQDEA